MHKYQVLPLTITFWLNWYCRLCCGTYCKYVTRLEQYICSNIAIILYYTDTKKIKNLNEPLIEWKDTNLNNISLLINMFN